MIYISLYVHSEAFKTFTRTRYEQKNRTKLTETTQVDNFRPKLSIADMNHRSSEMRFI